MMISNVYDNSNDSIEKQRFKNYILFDLAIIGFNSKKDINNNILYEHKNVLIYKAEFGKCLLVETDDGNYELIYRVNPNHYFYILKSDFVIYKHKLIYSNKSLLKLFLLIFVYMFKQTMKNEYFMILIFFISIVLCAMVLGFVEAKTHLISFLILVSWVLLIITTFFITIFFHSIILLILLNNDSKTVKKYLILSRLGIILGFFGLLSVFMYGKNSTVTDSDKTAVTIVVLRFCGSICFIFLSIWLGFVFKRKVIFIDKLLKKLTKV